MSCDEEARPIDIVVRGDFKLKNGGDTVQLTHYADSINRIAGWERARIVQDQGRSTVFRSNAFILLSNVDRPFELIELVTTKRILPTDYAICTIHHSAKALKRMRLNERGPTQRGILATLPEVVREFLVYAARVLALSHRSDPRGALATLLALTSAAFRVPRIRLCVKECIANAKFVVTLSAMEELALESDLGILPRPFLRVPNGGPSELKDGSHPLVPWHDRKQVVLCIGRIEPRKRQLEIASACVDKGFEVKFIGQLTDNARQYGEAFKEVVSSSANLEWLGQLDRTAVFEEMNAARVLINASWMEVQSLVDIEAVLHGMYVVCAEDSATAEYFPESVYTYEPGLIDEPVVLTDNLVGRTEGPGPARYLHTWDEAGRTLVDAIDRKK